MNRFALVLLALVLSFATAAEAVDGHKGDAGWLTDHAAATQRARAEKKAMLMLFTGSDWCGYCQRLQREVFNTEEFKAFAAKNLVLLEIDFPRRKKLAESLRKQNDRLLKQYEVEGFPTVAVFDVSGKLVGGLGYEPGGAKGWLAKLEKMIKKS